MSNTWMIIGSCKNEQYLNEYSDSLHSSQKPGQWRQQKHIGIQFISNFKNALETLDENIVPGTLAKITFYN